MKPSEKLWARIKSLDENHLERLLTVFPDKNWDWEALSKNPNITLNIVRSNINKPWDWRMLSANIPDVETLLSDPELLQKINWTALSTNPNYPRYIADAMGYCATKHG